MSSIFASIRAQYDNGLTDPLEIQEAVRKLHPHKIVGLGYVQECLRTLRELKNANDTAIALGKEMTR